MSLFKGERPRSYKRGMNKMWRLREKLGRMQGIGVLSPQQERMAREAQDLLWETMFGKGKKQAERDR